MATCANRTWTGTPAEAIWPPSLTKLAIWLWVVLGIVVGVKTLVEPRVHTNYPVFESAAHCWWAEQNMYSNKICNGCYRYGPPFTVAVAPLAAMPTWLGGLLWTWLNLAACFWSARVLARRVLPGEWTPNREAVFLMLVLLWSVRMIWAAQSNPLIVALVAGAAVAIDRKRWWTAAFLLSIAVHIKVWPLAAALLLVACWPRRLSWRLAVALLVVAAVPLVTKPPAVVMTRYHEWFAAMVGPMQLRHDYRDAWTIWELIHPPVPEQAYAILQLGGAAVVLGLCLWQRLRGATVPQLLTFILGTWLVFQLIFGPGTERNTFGILGPLAAWAVITAWTEKWGRVVMGAVLLLTVVAANGQVERALTGLLPAVKAAHPVGVLLFGAWLVVYSLRWKAGAANDGLPAT
jgi:hypothetical protein